MKTTRAGNGGLRRAASALLTAGIAAALTALPVDSSAQADPATVSTATGAVHGLVAADHRTFWGIPYAAPPVGALRWQAPQPAHAWAGTLDATKPRAMCPQLARFGGSASFDEDCLFLNVVTPLAPAAAGPLPVLVWIPGGAFVGGSSELYDLTKHARIGNAVVVSMNYRVGPLGYFAHPSLEPGTTGNYGLEDQRAALRWVEQNVAAFGGDPGNVTVIGESAGAVSICAMLSSPHASDGLFQKAVMESSTCVTHFHTLAEANALGLGIAKLVGCQDAAAAASCLRSKPVKALMEAGLKAGGGKLDTYSPTVGGATLPLQPREAFASGEFVRVPLIVGGNLDEMRLWVGAAILAGDAVTAQNYAEKLDAVYGAHAEEIAKEYPLAAYSSPAVALSTVETDYHPLIPLNDCGYLRTDELAAKYVRVYAYEFSDRDAPPELDVPGLPMGAAHSAELPLMFPGYDNKYPPSLPPIAPAQEKLGDQMVGYFTGFARSGNPNGPDLPKWPQFSSTADVLNLVPGNIHVYDAALQHKCELWRRLYPLM